jgi:hypothetical protein
MMALTEWRDSQIGKEIRFVKKKMEVGNVYEEVRTTRLVRHGSRISKAKNKDDRSTDETSFFKNIVDNRINPLDSVDRKDMVEKLVKMVVERFPINLPQPCIDKRNRAARAMLFGHHFPVIFGNGRPRTVDEIMREVGIKQADRRIFSRLKNHKETLAFLRNEVQAVLNGEI